MFRCVFVFDTDTFWLVPVSLSLLVCRAAQGWYGINASWNTDETWILNLAKDFLWWIEGGRIVTLCLWIFLRYSGKTFKPCKIQTTIIKSFMYRFAASEGMWRGHGRWMASSNGRDWLEEVKGKTEEELNQNLRSRRNRRLGVRKNSQSERVTLFGKTEKMG